jgi:hypothetical protein
MDIALHCLMNNDISMACVWRPVSSGIPLPIACRQLNPLPHCLVLASVSVYWYCVVYVCVIVIVTCEKCMTNYQPTYLD